MYKNVNHVFLGNRLILQNACFRVDKTGQSLMIVDSNGNNHTCGVQNVASIEFYYHQTGPTTSPAYNVIVVLRFSTELTFLCGPITPADVIVLTISDVFKEFYNIQHLVIKFTRLIKPDIVHAMPFTRIPQCVKDVIVQVARDYKRQTIRNIGEEQTGNGQVKKVKPILDDGIVELSSGDEEGESRPTGQKYYNIDGQRMQISAAGIQSLEPGLYLNDEIINLALKQAVAKHPHVHLFDTYQSRKIFDVFQNGEYDDNGAMEESVFKRNFCGYFFKGKGDREAPIDLADTFFAKKMLMFPICHSKHWYLVVVVNPLLADVHDFLTPEERPDSCAMAYFIDSLHGLRGHDTMGTRVSLTWNCIFSFIRLAASYYAYCYLSPKLITCVYESNLPPQTNNSDCGAHLVQNAALMAELYEDMIKSPPTVSVTEEQRMEVKEKVDSFRADYKAYLAGCRL